MKSLHHWQELRRLLHERTARDCPAEGMARAGILVPILQTESGPELLFTVRAAHMRRHPGQISFPGGHVEPGETLLDAAIRETHEEVGVTVHPEDVLGRLDSHPSPSGSCATPFVATVAWPQELKLSDLEVDSTFTVPLAELARIEPESRMVHHQGMSRLLYSYGWQGRNIWGLTGNVLHELLGIMSQVDKVTELS